MKIAKIEFVRKGYGYGLEMMMTSPINVYDNTFLNICTGKFEVLIEPNIRYPGGYYSKYKVIRSNENSQG